MTKKTHFILAGLSMLMVASAIAGACYIRQCQLVTICMGPMGCWSYERCEIVRTGVDCTNPGGPDNP